MKNIIQAAVAITIRNDGLVLLAKRPEGKTWSGWWEFPGGKIEIGETPYIALKRELAEEIGIDILVAHPWVTREFQYPEKLVKLHFFIIREWVGIPQGCEGQELSWQHPDNLTVDPILPANIPIFKSLRLPNVYAISNLAELGEKNFFSCLSIALENGLRLIQIRESYLTEDKLKALTTKVIEYSKPYGAKVLINGRADMANELSADGVHFSGKAMMQLQKRPENMICGASCHNHAELSHAKHLHLDFVVLSPVLKTLSHPGADGLGWERFSEWIKDYPIPVFALGGMESSSITDAWKAGAHGIAMQRAIWQV